MSEDLISGNFVDDADHAIVKKVFRLSKTILNLVIVYTIIDLASWYIAILNSFTYTFRHNSTFYEYRIHPVIAVIILALSITGSVFSVKANKLVALSLDKADAAIFNTAYQFHYKAAKMAIVSFCISIVSVSVRLLLK